MVGWSYEKKIPASCRKSPPVSRRVGQLGLKALWGIEQCEPISMTLVISRLLYLLGALVLIEIEGVFKISLKIGLCK